MARYIKANYKVAEFLKVENDRNKVKDGNYLLWQADMQAFGKLIDLPEILEQIGGIALQAHEAREEQDGSVIRPLPVAKDPRFIVEEPEPEDAEQEAAQDPAETDNENQGEAEEAAPEPNDEKEA